jgi:outer membrane lipoprotein SlyB
MYSGEWTLVTGSMKPFPSGKPVDLYKKIRAVEALAFDHDKGKTGVGGAAVGAVAGTLLAGPVGLMAGSLLGAKAGRREASDSFQVRVTMITGSSFIATVSDFELQRLNTLAKQTAT